MNYQPRSTNPYIMEKKLNDIKGSLNSISDNLSEVVNNLGAKNMLPNNATSQVVAGITYTINSDGSIMISGTSTASNGIVLSSNQLLHKGTYKTTTGQTQEEDADAFIYVQNTNTQRLISRSNDLEVPSQFTLANDTLVNYGVWVEVGKTVNVTIYPMVRPASIADDTYAPYAQTNKELTDNLTTLINKVSYQSVDISATTKYADIQDLITASIADNKCPYIICEFNLSGTIHHGVRIEYVRSGFGSTNNYGFAKALDNSSIFTMEVTTTNTIAKIGSTSMTFTDAKLYY